MEPWPAVPPVLPQAAPPIEHAKPHRRQVDLVVLCAIVLLSTAVSLSSLHVRSLWIDEWFTVSVAAEPSVSAVIQHAMETERRPPLQYLALHVWTLFAGSGEVSQRTFSVLCFVLALPVVFAVGRRFGGRGVGLWAAAMTAFSPFLLLYAPMVRAYSFMLLVGSLATLAFLRWRDRPDTFSWLLYVAAALALAYSDYVGLALLSAHAVVSFVEFPLGGSQISVSERAVPLRRRLLAFVVIGLGYLPWIGVVASQMQRPSLPADFAQSLPGYALKIAYPFYSLSLGETIFPWHPAALAGLAAFAAMAFSAWRFWRRSGSPGLTLAILFGLPLVFTIFVLSTFATDITFLNVPSRCALAAPYFYVLLAGGLVHLRPRLLFPSLALIGFAWAAALGNLLAGSQFHNPIYAVPVRQISQQIVGNVQAGDVVVADPDTVLAYYIPEESGFPMLSSTEPATLALLKSAPPPRVWLLTLGRDRTRDLEPVAVVQWLERGYALTEDDGFVAQEALYGSVKQRLLGRASYDHKALLRLYEKR